MDAFYPTTTVYVRLLKEENKTRLTYGAAVWRPVVMLLQLCFAESESTCERIGVLRVGKYGKFNPEERQEDLPLQR